MNYELGQSSGDEEVDRINEQGADTVQNSTRELCGEAISVGFAAVSYYLSKDKEAEVDIESRGYPVGEHTDVYVTQSTFYAPRQEKQFVRTYAARLEPRTSSGGKDTFLRLHIPVGDAVISGYELPDTEDVQDLYIENRKAGETHWYAINKFGLYEYIPYVQQDEDTSVLDDQGIWGWIDERIPESLKTISGLLTDIVNYKTVYQRQITIDSLPDNDSRN